MIDPDLESLWAAAGPVSRETFADLKSFQQYFLKWTGRINLVSESTQSDVWQRHILDSAQLVRLYPNARKWLDIGSGGGFPGAVIAILMKELPGTECHLVESNRKKASFLMDILGKTGAPATIHTQRIESMVPAFIDCEIVTARAVASLQTLLKMSEPWLSHDSIGLFHKGKNFESELEESREVWNFDLSVYPSQCDSNGVILGIRNLHHKIVDSSR